MIQFNSTLGGIYMRKLFDNKWIQFVVAVTTSLIIYKCFNNIDDIKGFFSYLWDVFFPIILGLIFALFLYKPISKLQRFLENKVHLKKSALALAIAGVLIAVFAVIVIAINFIVPPIYKNIEDLAKNLPSYYKIIEKFLMDNEYIKNIIPFEKITEIIPKIFNPESIAKYIGVISGVANWFLTVFISLILSIYLILEKNNIFNFFKLVRQKHFKSEKTTVAVSYAKKTVSLFYSYFTGLFIDAAFMGILSAIIYSIFNVPYAFMLGLVVAIGNLIPFFGPIIASVIVFIISAVTLGPLSALWLLILQFVLAQLDANLLQPKILSQSTGISPLLVLVSVTVFGAFWGAAGMILGVPVCAIVKTIIMDYLDDGVINGK